VDDTLRPGQANPVVTPEYINATAACIHDNHHTILKETATEINEPWFQSTHITHLVIGFTKSVQDREPHNLINYVKQK